MKRRYDDSVPHDLRQLLEDLDERAAARFHDMILNMPSRELVQHLQFMHDELERRLNPPTLH